MKGCPYEILEGNTSVAFQEVSLYKYYERRVHCRTNIWIMNAAGRKRTRPSTIPLKDRGWRNTKLRTTHQTTSPRTLWCPGASKPQTHSEIYTHQVNYANPNGARPLINCCNLPNVAASDVSTERRVYRGDVRMPTLLWCA
ncbi:hypothetical protein CEXT_79991 [Caerostris extrusa]|uniref:Uncharacterized protein n=1 Tax=Caerostris extrusa TaxID=172846 RepID=A0AAV4TCP0_CAEEX|nr:hypothetical protein CEXT_79991 [Caerostris extrusa]